MSKSGKSYLMRNPKTGAMWRVAFDYLQGLYEHQPLGNLAYIRTPYWSASVDPRLEAAGCSQEAA